MLFRSGHRERSHQRKWLTPEVASLTTQGRQCITKNRPCVTAGNTKSVWTDHVSRIVDNAHAADLFGVASPSASTCGLSFGDVFTMRAERSTSLNSTHRQATENRDHRRSSASISMRTGVSSSCISLRFTLGEPSGNGILSTFNSILLWGSVSTGVGFRPYR